MATGGQFPKDNTAPKEDLIFAEDYNTIRNLINPILGIGSGTSGYGATVTATAVEAVSAPTGTISFTQFNNLRSDIIRLARHQKGSDNTGLSAITTLTLINAAFVNTMKTAAEQVVTDKDLVANSELVAVTGISKSYSAAWNGTLSRAVAVNFASANNMRNFFNAGGSIRVTHATISGASGTKNINWQTAINNLGDVRFTRTNYRAGTSQQTLATSSVSAYSPSRARVYGQRTSDTSILITIAYEDSNVADTTPFVNGSATTGRIDENITLNITSTVGYEYSAGQVTSPTPQATGSWGDPGYGGGTPASGGGGGSETTFVESGTSAYTPGTYTFTQPAGSTAVKVSVQGAGGGGGNGRTFSTFDLAITASIGGGGGGGGAYNLQGFQLAAGASLSITVGAKGTGSTTTANGGNGGLSQVTLPSGQIIRAGGGGGGGTSTSSTNTPSGGTGGTASVVGGTAGLTQIIATNGGTATSPERRDRLSPPPNGWVSSGTAGNGGGAGNPYGGAGGTFTYNGPTIGATLLSASDGGSALGVAGGGGGGAAEASGSAVTNGGNGGNGQVIVFYGTGTTF
jgi:hypothetical protein